MSTEDRELEELRAIARLTRVEPDDAAVARLRARVAERLEVSPPLWEVLAAWFRPVAVTVAALLVALGLALAQQLASDSTDLLARATPALTADPEMYGD